MPAGKENARKRNAPAEPAGPRDVITIEVIDGPALGNVYDKQVRPDARLDAPTPLPTRPAKSVPPRMPAR